jgi:hypothetical protein
MYIPDANVIFYGPSYSSLEGPQTQIKIYKKTSLIICFSSIYMDQQLIYVRGCKRDFLHPVCKELFSLHSTCTCFFFPGPAVLRISGPEIYMCRPSLII